jgi:hypothetical protein
MSLSWISNPQPPTRRVWGILFALNAFLALAVMYVAWNNIRLVKAWDKARRNSLSIRRGCVQLEFSNDGSKWVPEDRLDQPYRFLRLHNTCSGMAVSVGVNGYGIVDPNAGQEPVQ